MKIILAYLLVYVSLNNANNIREYEDIYKEGIGDKYVDYFDSKHPGKFKFNGKHLRSFKSIHRSSMPKVFKAVEIQHKSSNKHQYTFTTESSTEKLLSYSGSKHTEVVSNTELTTSQNIYRVDPLIASEFPKKKQIYLSDIDMFPGLHAIDENNRKSRKTASKEKHKTRFSIANGHDNNEKLNNARDQYGFAHHEVPNDIAQKGTLIPFNSIFETEIPSTKHNTSGWNIPPKPYNTGVFADSEWGTMTNNDNEFLISDFRDDSFKSQEIMNDQENLKTPNAELDQIKNDHEDHCNKKPRGVCLAPKKCRRKNRIPEGDSHCENISDGMICCSVPKETWTQIHTLKKTKPDCTSQETSDFSFSFSSMEDDSWSF